MVKGGCPNAEKLRLIKKEEEEKGNHVIVLQKDFKSDETSFFNMELGSKCIFQNNILTFQPTSLTTSINEIKNRTSVCFHVSAYIKWIFDVKQISTNSKCQNAVLIDESGEIMVTMCQESLLCMEEDVCYTIIDMNRKDYFGLKLQSSRKTSVEVLPKVCDITLPDLTMYQNRENITVLLEAISTCSISDVTLSLIANCPGNNCSGSLIDPFLKITNFSECNQKVIVARCPKGITGNIDVENLTLHITGKIIGNIFRAGTCELYNSKTDELEEKLLLLENLKIGYNSKTLEVLKMVLMNERP